MRRPVRKTLALPTKRDQRRQHDFLRAFTDAYHRNRNMRKDGGFAPSSWRTKCGLFRIWVPTSSGFMRTILGGHPPSLAVRSSS